MKFDDTKLDDLYTKIASNLFIYLHHKGGEAKRGRDAAAATGERVITFDVCQAMKDAYGSVRAKKAGDTAQPFGMEPLAHCADTVQQHGSYEDCVSQTEVWNLLVSALYRHLRAAIASLPAARGGRRQAKKARTS